MKTVRIMSLLVGVLMLLQWSFFILTGNVPELQSEPLSISFHLFIEFTTAVLLILSFFLLRKAEQWRKYLAVYAQGMLGYTVVNSPGYFAQAGEWNLVVMFAVLLVISITNTVLIIRSDAGASARL